MYTGINTSYCIHGNRGSGNEGDIEGERYESCLKDSLSDLPSMKEFSKISLFSTSDLLTSIDDFRQKDFTSDGPGAEALR